MSRLRSHLNRKLVAVLFVLALGGSLLGYAASSTTSSSQTRSDLGTADQQTQVRTSRETSLLPIRSTCPVVPDKELFITNVSVVDDCLRTTWGPCITPPGPLPATQGAWTFAANMAAVAGTNAPAALSAYTTNWLNQWNVNLIINGDPVPSRTAVQTEIIDPWRTASGGTKVLDMTKAPFRLLAIVARLDLRGQSGYVPGATTAGEGRFIYNLLDQFGNPTQYLVIFEYGLDAEDCVAILNWARAWHSLGSLSFGPSYNAALQQITDRFATIGASPRKPNRSAINQVRTNDFHLDRPWELRESQLDPRSLAAPVPLLNVTVAQTPARSLQQTAAISTFVNSNTPAILSHTHVVPLSWAGNPFRGGASPHSLDLGWDGPPPSCTSITDPEARHAFSLDTCSGCHGEETATFFKHVEPRNAGVPSALSAFLTGSGPVVDRCGRSHTFSDIDRRRVDLCQLLERTCREIDEEPVITFVH
ncbi:MAG TPA: hypothetical protein VKK31_28865 [Thermoanaerobaculia bacterium]|nr:hypothetical protein [Thermoanaerobaculia bacterium]